MEKKGGYSNFREITNEEKKMFKETLANFVGVKHTSLAVATQIVSGTNYAFLCDSLVIVPEAVPHNEIVVIYRPLQGAPIIKEIKEVKII